LIPIKFYDKNATNIKNRYVKQQSYKNSNVGTVGLTQQLWLSHCIPISHKDSNMAQNSQHHYINRTIWIFSPGEKRHQST